MKKLNFKLELLIGLMIFGSLLSSCEKDFLDKKPQGTLDINTLATQKGVNDLLIGAYSLLDGVGVYNGWPDYAYPSDPKMWVWDLASDDSYKGSTLGDLSSAGDIERYDNLPSNIMFSHFWMTMYDGVSRANDVLKALKLAKDIKGSDTKVIRGQALFLRAYYHFRLQEVFFQVPYITEKTKHPENVKNDHVIWPEIQNDLQDAMDDLTYTVSDPGRPTKWAAMALKAYVYLFQQKYSDAEPLLDSIIDSHQFSLVHNFFDNYLAVTNNNAESIFEIQSSVNDGATQGKNGNAGSWTTNPQNPALPTCCDMHKPSQDLVNAFKVNANGLPLLGINGSKYNDQNLENDMGIASDEVFHPTTHLVDPRLDWTIGRRGIPYLDWGIHTGKDWIRDQANGGSYSSKKGMYYKKNMDIAAEASFKRSTAINFRLIRYAHILLWRGECAVAENDLETARKLVNEVRKRANNEKVMGKVTTYKFGSGVTPNVDYNQPAANYKVEPYPSFPNKDYAWAAVRMEERLEFAMDGFRFFDLVRWGIADKVLNSYVENDSKFRTFMQGSQFIKGKNDHFPIPLDQIDLQSDIIQQDSAYQ